MRSIRVAYLIMLIFSLVSSSQAAVITLANSVNGITNSVDSDVEGNLFTTTSFDMSGGNSVALMLTTEGAGGSAVMSATYAGEDMNIVRVNEPGQSSAIFYLIEPTNTVGVFNVKVDAGLSSVEYAYSQISLANVGGIAGTDTFHSTISSSSTPMELQYTTAYDGGWVLGAAVNNDYNDSRNLYVTGNPDIDLLSFIRVKDSGHFHSVGDVVAAGSYTDSYYKQYGRNAVAILALDATPDIELSGVYDPASANDVDQSGTFLSGTGGGSAANVLDLATFKPLVATAFDEGTGGVFSFEGAGDILDSGTAFTSSALAGGFTATFNLASINTSISYGSGSGNRVPVSGTHALGRGTNPDFDFNALTISGGGYGLTHFGATIIHRQDDGQTWSVKAYFSGGGTVTFEGIAFASTDLANSKDTFFGIVAPVGETISRIFFNGASGHYTFLDDVAFISNVPSSIIPPPPASVVTFSDSSFGTGQDVIQWTTSQGFGYAYSVWYSTNLLDGFQPLETNLADTVQSITNIIDATPVFYKVEAQ